MPTHWHNEFYMSCGGCDDLVDVHDGTLVAVNYENQFTLLCQWEPLLQTTYNKSFVARTKQTIVLAIVG